MKKIVTSISTLTLVLCLSAGLALAGDPPKLVGLAIPESGTDKGWNEQGKVGLEIIAKKYGFKIELGEALGYGDIKPTLRDMAKKGCELIIAHAAGYQTVAPEIARETGVKILTCLNHKDITPGLISDYDFKSGEGGYLAGVLAGEMTRSNIIGICAGAEPSNFNRLSAGFIQGLKSVNPDAKILHSLVGPQSYADAAGGKRNAVDIISVGADVIFGMGDGASFGMLQACSAKKAKDGGKVWFIDVIGDKRDVDNADILLTSVLFDFSVIYDEVIKSIIDGTFGKQHWVSFSSGAIYLMELNKAVPAEVIEKLDAISKKIKSGEIEVVDIPVAAEMHRYLKKMFPSE